MACRLFGTEPTNVRLLSIGPLATNFSEISIKIQRFSFTKLYLKVSSVTWRPFCPGEDYLTLQYCRYTLLTCFVFRLGFHWNVSLRGTIDKEFNTIDKEFKSALIASANGLEPNRRQAITKLPQPVLTQFTDAYAALAGRYLCNLALMTR